MKLLIQPGAGVTPLTKAIDSAKRSVEIAIFRFNRSEIERALGNAVARGVSAHALIAHTNRAGEENLRALELRLLALGCIVSRTAGDLKRYHGKYMIIDRRELWVLAFNPTYADMERSRSFAVVTKSRGAVREAVRLFEADATRQNYEPQQDRLVVSPANSRRLLAEFIRAAKSQLIIYDPKISDPTITRLLEARAQGGVDVRMIGQLVGKVQGVNARKLGRLRLHTRTMVRDGKMVFLGSQSLREEELDARREVGLIFRDVKIAARLMETFEADWSASETAVQPDLLESARPAAKVAKKIAKAVAKEMPPVAPLLNGAVKEVANQLGDEALAPEEVEILVKGAVKEAMKDVIRDVVEEAVKKNSSGAL